MSQRQQLFILIATLAFLLLLAVIFHKALAFFNQTSFDATRSNDGFLITPGNNYSAPTFAPGDGSSATGLTFMGTSTHNDFSFDLKELSTSSVLINQWRFHNDYSNPNQIIWTDTLHFYLNFPNGSIVTGSPMPANPFVFRTDREYAIVASGDWTVTTGGASSTLYGTNLVSFNSAPNVYYINSSFATSSKMTSPYLIYNNFTPPPPTVSMVFPTATTTQDFQNWSVGWTVPDCNSYSLKVLYTANNGNLNFSDVSSPFPSCVALSPQVFSKTNALWFPPMAPTGTIWTATPLLLGSSSQTLATGTPVTFTISPFTASTSTAPNGTSTAVITCDPNSGFFQNSFCNILTWLFVPSQSALDFTAVTNVLKTKPPIGYFALVATSVQSFSGGTSTIVLLDTTSTAELAPIFSPLRTGLSWLFWVLYAFWLYWRIKHLNLNS